MRIAHRLRFLGRFRGISGIGFGALVFGLLIVVDGVLYRVPIGLRLASVIPVAAAIALWALKTRDPRETINRLAVLIGATVIGVYVCENLFRFALLEPKVPVSDNEFVKWIASSWPRHIPQEKNPGTFRILGLSDSFGRAGERDNYHYLLESLLRKAGVDAEMVNFSVGEYQPGDEALVLGRFGPLYHPDMVLHGFFVGNDFSVPKGGLMTYEGISLRSSGGFLAYRPRNLLLRRWLTRYVMALRDQRRRIAERARGEPVGSFSREAFLELERERMRLVRIGRRPDAEWQETVTLLDRVRGQVDRMQARYVMVIHPDQFQVEEEELPRLIAERYSLNLDDYDFDLPQRFLGEYCTSRGIPCLDLLPTFRSRSSKGGLFLLMDSHYSREGNELAAETILGFLRERRLLPPVGEKHRK